MATTQTINLQEGERSRLSGMTRRGRWRRQEVKRAQILLLADGEKTICNSVIAQRLGCDRDTVREIRKRYMEEGLDGALCDRPRPGQPKKITVQEEALIVATACSNVPAGHDHWTIEMLTDFINKKRKGNPISKEPIVRVLLQNELKPWLKKNVGNSRSHTGVRSTAAGRS